MEAALRRRALAALRRGRAAGDDPSRISAALGLGAARLRAWQHEHDERVRQRARPASLGRPPLSCDPTTAKALRHHLAVFGPAVGMRGLKADFPDVSFRECAQIAWRFRRDLRDQFDDCTMMACTWTSVGTVWAADVWNAARPVGGLCPYILDVRDLASGYIIESAPLLRCTSELVSATLERLYDTIGAPLVIKFDNGSEFIDGGSTALHERWGVETLRSPPDLPSYNGSCEAGHGSIRFHTELLARRDGSPGQWTFDHLEGGRTWSNEVTTPGRPGTATDRFAANRPIGLAERAAFRSAVAQARRSRWIQLSVAAQVQDRTIALMSAPTTVNRAAISATLRNMGYLITRNVPIRQRIPFENAS
jgi:hypothetical protein